MEVMKVLFGSHLYGTNTPESDTDYKAIYLPCGRDILLQRARHVISSGPSKSGEGVKNEPGDVDTETFSLQQYLFLLGQGQTAAIDMLFSPNPIVTTQLWDRIRENKDKLLTKKSAAFVGYCRQQANKYGIKGSRVAAAKKAMEIFNLAVQNLGATAKVLELDGRFVLDDHTHIVEKETTPGKYETYFECCNRMVGFKNTVKEAAHIFTRIYEEYGARARKAESNDGIDWKALSHAVRVGGEALELLTTHNVTFPLPNAAHVLEIKQGRITYNRVAEEIEQLLVDVERAAEESTLPDKVDQQWVDDLVCHVYGNIVRTGNA